MTRWEKERLTEQLKFFGSKKTKFISCYARKPRILLVNKPKEVKSHLRTDIDRQIAALYQNQLNRGLQGSVLGFSQMVAAQQAQQMGLHPNSLIGSGQAGGMGGLCGFGGLGAHRQ